MGAKSLLPISLVPGNAQRTAEALSICSLLCSLLQVIPSTMGLFHLHPSNFIFDFQGCSTSFPSLSVCYVLCGTINLPLKILCVQSGRVRSISAQEKGVGAEVLLKGKASMLDAKLFALMNTWDLTWREEHISQREVVCCGPVLFL